MEYKKSYKGLVLWLAGFCAALLLLMLLPIRDEAIGTRLICNLMTLFLALLTWIIYKTEAVYWYNGTEFEAARDAGSERRKAFAWKHFELFGWSAVIYLVFSIIAQVFSLPFWLDLVFAFVLVIGTAFSTMPIKL